MPIKLCCPHCNLPLSVPETLGGTTGICPSCRKAVPIPAAPPVEVTLVEPTVAPSKPPPPFVPSAVPDHSARNTPKQSTNAPGYAAAGIAGLVAILAVLKKILIPTMFATRAAHSFKMDGLFAVLLVILIIIGVICLIAWIVQKVLQTVNTPQTVYTPSVTPAATQYSPPRPSPAASRPSPPPAPPAPTQTVPIDSGASHWWLLFGNQSTGPYATAAIIEGISAGDFQLDVLVCPVGGSQWQPISAWSAFVQNATSAANIPPARTISLYDP